MIPCSAETVLLLCLPPLRCLKAKQLVHSASSMSLAEVKEQLLQKPKEALSNAAATLGTCQANLSSLSQSLQSSLAEGRSNLERHLSTLGEPGSPSSASSRLAALLSTQRLPGLSGGVAADGGSTGEEQQGGEALPPWSLLPAPMRGREAAAIEALVTEDEQDGQQEEELSGGRGWGPFQVRLGIGPLSRLGLLLPGQADRQARSILTPTQRVGCAQQPVECTPLAAAPAYACILAEWAWQMAAPLGAHASSLADSLTPCQFSGPICSGRRSGGGAARTARREAACVRTAGRC